MFVVSKQLSKMLKVLWIYFWLHPVHVHWQSPLNFLEIYQKTITNHFMYLLSKFAVISLCVVISKWNIVFLSYQIQTYAYEVQPLLHYTALHACLIKLQYSFSWHHFFISRALWLHTSTYTTIFYTCLMMKKVAYEVFTFLSLFTSLNNNTIPFSLHWLHQNSFQMNRL